MLGNNTLRPLDEQRESLQVVEFRLGLYAHPKVVGLVEANVEAPLTVTHESIGEQEEPLVRQQRCLEDGDVVDGLLESLHLESKRRTCTDINGRCVAHGFQLGFEQTDGRRSLHLLAGYEIGTIAFHDAVGGTIDIVLYLLCLGHQSHKHHFGYRVHLLVVEIIDCHLLQTCHRLVDSFL